MSIKVKESSMVQPSKETPKEIIWLSNLDLIQPRRHTPIVYFYTNNTFSNFFDSVVLKEALSKALVPFYPVAGRLNKCEDGRLVINCDGQGVVFVVAEADHVIDDSILRGPTKNFIPPLIYSDDISLDPMLVLQVTHFKCGGVSLGMGISHKIVDGIAGLHFTNTWADMARGLDITFQPIIDRTPLRARDPPAPVFEHTEYSAPPVKNTNSQETSLAIFKISRDQLNILKAKSKGSGDTIHYSSFEILTGHIWRSASMARGLLDDQETKIYVSVDGRSRLIPPIPQGYFGNVIFHTNTYSLAGDLSSKPLTHAAGVIHDALVRMDNEYLRSAIDHLELNLSTLGNGPHVIEFPSIKIISWTRLPFFDADFGWGRPNSLGQERFSRDGHVYIFPNPVHDGSFTFSIALQPEHMKPFEKILYEFEKDKVISY